MSTACLVVVLPTPLFTVVGIVYNRLIRKLQVIFTRHSLQDSHVLLYRCCQNVLELLQRLTCYFCIVILVTAIELKPSKAS